ncbi:LytTR family DNA-binding domain-containing protein [Saprospiraceae bacterium]|nr:LytTR family DNA-binding domain-containing protein [Saprospiraceae bacterium]
MFTTFIIDDENPARLRIKKLLEAYTDKIEVVGEADCGKDAITKIEKLRPEVLFLDIQLPDMTGFEILRNLTYRPLVIFSTAYEQYAVQAFESYSIDYLVKPFDAVRFAKSIEKLEKFGKESPQNNFQDLEKLMEQFQPKQKSYALPVQIGDRILLVDFEDITHFQAENKYTRVITKSGKKHLSDTSLGQLDKELPEQFLRVHRSFIINKMAILEIRKYFKGKLILILEDKERTAVTTGETYSKKVRQALGI